MSFKNVGAPYQRLNSKMFSKLMGNTVEAYINGMLIKSKKAQDHIKNANEVFMIFWEFKMKLNPLKCTFRVSSR